MKEIVIGSYNKTKVNAVQQVFPNYMVTAEDVPSNISKQPVGDDETRQGAINRSFHAQKSRPGSIGIGLEGGVMCVSEKLYLCNWGALRTEDGQIYTSAGARIELPEMFLTQLKKGVELSEIMTIYAARTDIRNHEGAIGIFTKDLVDRSAMFEHVVTLLKGQYAYWYNEE